MAALIAPMGEAGEMKKVTIALSGVNLIVLDIGGTLPFPSMASLKVLGETHLDEPNIGKTRPLRPIRLTPMKFALNDVIFVGRHGLIESQTFCGDTIN